MGVSDSSIYKINIKTNKISKIIQFQPTPRYADFNTKAPFAFAFKNNDLYVATRDSNIYRVNTITKTKTLLIKLKTRPGDAILALAFKGTDLYVGTSSAGNIYKINTMTKAKTLIVTLGWNGVYSFVHDGNQWYIGSGNSCIYKAIM